MTDASANSPRPLRFVTLNLWGENGPHERRLALIAAEAARLAPDVVALQEVRQVPGRLPNQAQTLAQALGAAFTYVFAPSTAWGGGDEGLAVVSRFPILEHAARPLPHATETEGRIVLSVRVDVPGGDRPAGRGLWVHTTHLSYRVTEGDKRGDQVQAVHAEVAARAGTTDLPQLVMGDLNTVPDADEIRWLRGLTSLGGAGRVYYQDAWMVVHGDAPGITWARENPFRARMGWLPADRRLDYVLVTAARKDGRGRVTDARVAFATPDADGVYPSDHAGVVADVQVTPDPPNPNEARA